MSRDMVYEDVPFVSRRQGDNVTAGQNNATIILGRDRVSSVDTGYGSEKGTGAIHAVVGRKSEDPNVAEDAATLYLSQKSDPDEQAGTVGVGKQDHTARPTAVLRADCIRVSSRADLKISVGKAYMTMTADGKIVLEGDIQLGEDAAQRILRGDAFAKYWNGPGHVHPTPTGMSGPPQNPLPDELFSPTNKVR